MKKLKITTWFIISLAFSINAFACHLQRGTGDLGIIIQRASGSILIVEHTNNTILCEVKELGDLSHASAVYSRDQRYVYIFGRDGGLTKVDLLSSSINKRVVQAGNSIGGAISQDGQYVAVSNYEPGGIKIFDADTLDEQYSIPATINQKNDLSKTVGLVDAPNNRFVFSLFEGNSTWIIDLQNKSSQGKPKVTKYHNIGKNPYDALITANGRYYIAGLFGEDGLALLDLWQPQKDMRKILSGYGRGQKKLPVYKMPHLEGWAMTDQYAFLPAIGQHELLVVNKYNWQEKTRIQLYSQPVFAMASPDGRQIWINFAFPKNDTLQVVDTHTLKIIQALKAGKGVLHMEFTPKGEHIWVSVRDKNEIQIYDTQTFKLLKTLPAQKPSGIFFSNRAHKIGL